MADLVAPTETVRRSFLEAMAEFRAEGRGGADDDTMIGSEHRRYGDTWHTVEGFQGYLRALWAEGLPDTPRPEGWVPQTTLWWLEGEEYLARIGIRHSLTPFLRDVGGHIGYDVRPTARRLGHATAMLAAALPVAYGLGIESVLITCDADNHASRTVIERNGGVLEDQRGEKLRFWVVTH
ncbi:MAG: GNAT family N-acetyltransferase [Micromonosporaceae bacterium]